MFKIIKEAPKKELIGGILLMLISYVLLYVSISIFG